MRTYKRVVIDNPVEKQVEDDVICNKCGERKKSGITNPFTLVKIWFEYGSKYDDDYWEFDICDDCIDSIIKTFKYSPLGFKKQEEFDEWKNT